MDFFYMRNPAFAMVARGACCFFLRPGDTPVTLKPFDVEKLSRFMQAAAMPMSEGQVDAQIDKQTRSLLVEAKVLLHAPPPVLKMLLPAARPAARPCRHLVLGLTGAISSVQVVPFVLDLLEGFADKVDVVLTKGALHMVNPEAFSFFGARVWTDAFEPRGEIRVPHIHLAEAAELVAVLPASAHVLHKFAHAECSDLLSLVVAATQAPVVIFPAMNRAMWDNPAVSRNIQQLRDDGCYVVEPGLGHEVAHLPDPELSYGVAGLAGLGLGKFLEQILGLHARKHAGPA